MSAEPVTAGPPSPHKNNGPKLEGEALQEALRTQLEFYFSKQNLQTDSYLLAQMNQHPNKSVPVDIICNFRKIKNLTETKSLVLEAMRNCKNLSLDESAGLVRSNIKVERSTLILRDIPADANGDELRAVFEDRPKSLAKGKIVSLTPDINDTWFVNFDSESTCMDVCLDIQSNAFTENSYNYRGKPIQARVKNESLQRGFYTGPPQTNANAPSSLLTPMGAPMGVNPYMQPPYFYPQYPMGPGFPVVPVGPAGFMPMPAGGVPLAAGAAGAPTSKAAKKEAAAAAAAAQQAQAASKKAEKKAKQTQPVAASATSPTAAAVAAAATLNPDGTAAQPKKKKKKGADAPAAGAVPASAPVSASGVPLIAPAALGGAAADSTFTPSASTDKSHLIAIYGHAPRLYSREQIAAVVDQFIVAAKANPALLKRPEGFNSCIDPEKAVLKDKPSTSYSILDPFPVIYPASPSPLLAAQPHHSGSLPFLELGGGALDAPYFSADAGFAAGPNQGAGGRRKSKSGEAGKKPAGSNNGSNNGSKSARVQGSTGSPSIKPRSAPQNQSQQPKIVPPPPIQPSSASTIIGTASSSNASVTSPPATKPTSFAAAALAAANAPIQPAQPKIVPPKPVQPATARPASASNTKDANAQQQQKKKADKPKKQNNGQQQAAPASAAAAPAKPTTPVVTFASRLAAISPAEAAAKAAQQAAQKAAKEKAANADKAEKSPAPAAAASSGNNGKNSSNNSKSSSNNNNAASTTSPSPESPAKAAFSYAAMIKKAPAGSPATPAAATATKTGATTGSKDAAAAAPGVSKSDAGNWRAQQ